MRLATREWGPEGEGPRPTALLVHGIMSDSRTWRLIGPALAARGYHVVAVDLRGHGASARDTDYAPAAYGADLVETMAAFDPPALAIGHSLGGLALLRAVDALRPGRAVYVDPAWNLAPLGQSFDPSIFVRFADAVSAQTITALNPDWAAEDVEIELATLQCWDRHTATALAPLAGTSAVPTATAVPSMLMLPGRSPLLAAHETDALRAAGFTVRTVPGTGHTIHRDDPAGFVTALEGWV